ncbi:muscleblind-like protein 1 [Dinothrombium tinctorium]|uniref:Muscleblind-like protein 1 n=1 Tax=Dinothrombium tinctorium TaxID=1965070 RepID=A0A3S3PUP8_9ACAR|nr:muscleblind-like protein 1 [Dinothrombium tinctorium]
MYPGSSPKRNELNPVFSWVWAAMTIASLRSLAAASGLLALRSMPFTHMLNDKGFAIHSEIIAFSRHPSKIPHRHYFLMRKTFPGVVPLTKRPALEKSGIPMYQPNAASAYQQTLAVHQSFVPLSLTGHHPGVPRF